MTKTFRDFRGDEPADNLTDAFRRNQDALAELFLTRHRVYGPENIRLPGMAGIAVHLLDKWARVKGIVLDGKADEGETLEDSLADLAVYAIIGLMLKAGEWDLPCLERGDESNNSAESIGVSRVISVEDSWSADYRQYLEPCDCDSADNIKITNHSGAAAVHGFSEGFRQSLSKGTQAPKQMG